MADELITNIEALIGVHTSAFDEVLQDARKCVLESNDKDKTIDALSRALAAAKADLNQANRAWEHNYFGVQDKLAAATARAEQYAKDAARYEWLRECSDVRSDRMMYVLRNHYDNERYLYSDSPSHDALDTYIDAALAQAQPEPQGGEGK